MGGFGLTGCQGGEACKAVRILGQLAAEISSLLGEVGGSRAKE